MDIKTELLGLLGLEAAATDEQLSAGLTAFKSEIQNRKTELETFKNRIEEMEKKELEAQVELDLDKFKDRIVNREQAKELLLKNREDGLKLIESMHPVSDDKGQKILNRADGATPDAIAEADATRAQDQREFVEETKIKNRLSSNVEAYNMAQRLKPDLFKVQAAAQ